ncbi:MAG: purine-binding chemotaxis protein CheW [Nitrospirae bacterium]|nr:purine-binding chemotaxis protein CheW [Nitrospirota bacterium]
MDLFIFKLEEQLYALRLASVERVFRIVEITALPKAPDVVFGVINVHGRIVPVMNVRKRFGLPERGPSLSDQLVLARTSRRSVALVAEGVQGIIEKNETDIIGREEIIPGIEHVEGVVKLEGGMVFIHDLDRFLSVEEEDTLDRAMEGIRKQ